MSSLIIIFESMNTRADQYEDHDVPNVPESRHSKDVIYTSNSTDSNITANQDMCCFRPNNGFFQSVFIIIIISLIIFVIIDTLTTKDVEQYLIEWVQLIEHHLLWGIIILVLVYTIATLCLIPGSVLTIGVGYAYGQAFPHSPALAIAFASASVFVGASAGSICCLLFGRYLFRDWVLRHAKKYRLFVAIDRALESNGLKIMILLRLSPLIPNHALDYISGVTSISIKDYWIASIGIMPSTVGFCYIGATASSVAEGTDNANQVQTTMLLVGLFFAFAGAMLASFYAKKELDNLLNLEMENHDNSSQKSQNEMKDVESISNHRNGIHKLQQPISANEYHLFQNSYECKSNTIV